METKFKDLSNLTKEEREILADEVLKQTERKVGKINV